MREFFDIFLADDSHHEMVELYSQIFDGEYWGRFEGPGGVEGDAVPVEVVLPEGGVVLGYVTGHHGAVRVQSGLGDV